MPGAGCCRILRCQLSAQTFRFMLLLCQGMLEPGYRCFEGSILPYELLQLLLSLGCNLLIALERTMTWKTRTVKEHNE